MGPPGVGKTSIGKSVAKALGRKYERVSFGEIDINVIVVKMAVLLGVENFEQCGSGIALVVVPDLIDFVEHQVEQLALLMHNPDGKSPILCLVGPPGVGKTSIGKSAVAMNSTLDKSKSTST